MSGACTLLMVRRGAAAVNRVVSGARVKIVAQPWCSPATWGRLLIPNFLCLKSQNNGSPCLIYVVNEIMNIKHLVHSMRLLSSS